MGRPAVPPAPGRRRWALPPADRWRHCDAGRPSTPHHDRSCGTVVGAPRWRESAAGRRFAALGFSYI